MKSISLISGVLFMAFMISATAIVYWAVVPSIQKMQCSVVMNKMKSSLSDLDGVIQKVASEGEGSKRVVTLNVEEGGIRIDGENDAIYWEDECNSPIMSPRVMQIFGNVVFGSNLDTEASQSSCEGEDAFVLENEHLKACMKKIGSENESVRYNMSDVLISVYQKDQGRVLPMEYLEITLDNNQTSAVGDGYTKLQQEGLYLPYGEVTAHMESDYGITYDVKFILESGEDFLTIKGE